MGSSVFLSTPEKIGLQEDSPCAVDIISLPLTNLEAGEEWDLTPGESRTGGTSPGLCSWRLARPLARAFCCCVQPPLALKDSVRDWEWGGGGQPGCFFHSPTLLQVAEKLREPLHLEVGVCPEASAMALRGSWDSGAH